MMDNALAEERIRNRAYQIYREHGRQPHHDLDDWAQAESELLQLPIQQITKLESFKRNLGNRPSRVSLIRVAVLFGAGVLTQLQG